MAEITNETVLGTLVALNHLMKPRRTTDSISSNSAHQSEDENMLIKIDEINMNLTVPWKIQATVDFIYPKKTFTNQQGEGEIFSCDLVDDTGSITLIAFNAYSLMLTEKIQLNKTYEISGLSIREAVDTYKTLSHSFQLTCSKATHVREIATSFYQRSLSSFTHLDFMETLPLNSIIDVDVQVIQDYGCSMGSSNRIVWTRRQIHVKQDQAHCAMTLWNELARVIDRNMIGMRIQFKNIKISWFNGSRILATLQNSKLIVI